MWSDKFVQQKDDYLLQLFDVDPWPFAYKQLLNKYWIKLVHSVGDKYLKSAHALACNNHLFLVWDFQ